MNIVCEEKKCTGCGMCENICNTSAITMVEGIHGFIYPQIDKSKCIDCGLCIKRCPANKTKDIDENIQAVYAGWCNDKFTRKNSTSGGIFSVIVEHILENNGVVVGVSWDEDFCPHHIIIDKIEEISLIRGSKYCQSSTTDIYTLVKQNLLSGKLVLFSGTPCQNSALRSFLNKEYDNLFMVDVVCHGVPSYKVFEKYFTEFNKKIISIQMRKKDPYWEYPYVYIEFDDNTAYKALTVDDPYYNLFNVGYILRDSCHKCEYSNTHRYSDLTLADYWGFVAHNFKTRNYNKGTSLILVNSSKGEKLINAVEKNIFLEKSQIEMAKKGNKCLSEPFDMDEDRLLSFWEDYDNGASISELNEKYCANAFVLPKHYKLRTIYHRWKWLIK